MALLISGIFEVVILDWVGEGRGFLRSGAVALELFILETRFWCSEAVSVLEKFLDRNRRWWPFSRRGCRFYKCLRLLDLRRASSYPADFVRLLRYQE